MDKFKKALDHTLDELDVRLGNDWKRLSLVTIEDEVHDIMFRYNEKCFGYVNPNELYKYIVTNYTKHERI